MATLAGATIASTYATLIKLDANDATLVAASGANAIQLKTGDNDATPIYLNTDRVGIGTNEATAVLHVKTAAGNCGLTLQAAAGGSDPIISLQNNGESYLIFHDDTDDALKFYSTLGTDGTRITFTGAGYVGIGDEAPGALLEVTHPTAPVISTFRKDDDINNDESLGVLIFKGSAVGTAATRVDGAAIQGKCTEDWTASGFDQPTSLLFFTQDNASGNNDLTTGNEAFVIDQNNKVGVNIAQTQLSAYGHQLYVEGMMSMKAKCTWVQKDGQNPTFDIVLSQTSSWTPTSITIETADVNGDSSDPNAAKFHFMLYTYNGGVNSVNKSSVTTANHAYGAENGFTVTISDLGATTVGGIAVDTNPIGVRIALTGGNLYQTTLVRIVSTYNVMTIV